MNAFMAHHVDADPNLQWTLKEVFAAEGGLARDAETGKAFAGITPGNLDHLNQQIKDGDISDRNLPTAEGSGKQRRTPDLTPEQAANAHRANLDDVMRKYGGVQALETLPDKKTAAVIADTQFLHGSEGGAQIVKDATNDVINDLSPKEQRKLGVGELTDKTGAKDTFGAIRNLSKGGHDQALRNSIAGRRLRTPVARDSKGVQNRIDHFRFSSP